MIAKLIALVLPLGLDTFAVAAAIGVSASERRTVERRSCMARRKRAGATAQRPRSITRG
jgi:hypothetical protein